MNLPDAPSCARNRDPILTVLADHVADGARLLEIGSGTGQHAVYMAPRLPLATWQTSDRAENLDGIRAWLEAAPDPRFPPPIELDVVDGGWSELSADLVFTANTCHIMPWPAVCSMFAGVSQLLPPQGVFIVYGPFIREHGYAGEGDRRFDRSLQERDPEMGLRTLEAIDTLATEHDLWMERTIDMPANNLTLVFRRGG